MAPPADAETMGIGDPMDLGTDNADLDTEMVMDAPNSNKSLIDRASEGVGHESAEIRAPANETPSIFDAFPEEFVPYQDDDAGRTFYGLGKLPNNTVSIYGQRPKTPTIDPFQLPYSYMIEYAGQVPKVLSSVDPDIKAWGHKNRNPQSPTREKDDDTPAFNIAGEEALERRFRHVFNPVNYLIVVRGFRLLMTLRNMTIGDKAPLDAKTISLLIGRLFCGDRATLAIFNEHFLPKNLEIVPAMADGEVRAHYNSIYCRIATDKAFRTHETLKLLSLLAHLAREPLYSHRWQQEHVGRLRMIESYTSLHGKAVEVPDGGAEVPHGPELPRCVELSSDFMRRFGKRWPFDVDPLEVDVCGLIDERGPRRTALRPRQLDTVPRSDR